MSCKSYLREDRIVKVQKGLSKASALLIEDPVDLYYLTGVNLSAGKLWICPEAAELFVDKRYWEEGMPRMEEEESFLRNNGVELVYFDGSKTTYNRALELQKYRCQSMDAPVEALRTIKDPQEIEILKQSAAITWQGFLHVQSLLCEGVSEQQLAAAFTIFCLEKGAQKTSFDPIIAFGENSAKPHHRAGDRRLKKGDIVLIDIGVIYKNYCSDMTRTLFFAEEDPLLKSWSLLVRKAHAAAVARCRHGVAIREVDAAARQVFRTEGVEQHFVHNLGHGVGLEIHENPRLKSDSEGTLLKGMVITIEPGLYLPGKGGIRHEDTVVVLEEGVCNLFS